jgi:WD40 repeat protein
MSPEQAEFNQLDIDTRSDIYSLGVLLYELLAGTTPFDRERLRSAAFDEVLRIIRVEEPPKPSTKLNSSDTLQSVAANRHIEPAKLPKLVRGELDWIVMKALDKDRNRRYETASGLASDIERYLRDEPVVACPPSALYRFRKFATRNKATLVSVGLLLTLLAAATAISAFLAVRATEAEGLAEQRLQAEEAAKHDAVRERDTAKLRLFTAKQAEAKASRWSRQVGQRYVTWATLTEAAKLAGESQLDESERASLRNDAIACLALPDLREAQKFSEAAAHVEFDADLKHYARNEPGGVISVVEVSSQKVVAQQRGMARGFFTFSPNGDYLAIQSSSKFVVWNWQRNTPVLEIPKHIFNAAVGFSPDSQLVAIGQRDGKITIYELPGGKERKSFDTEIDPMHIAFRPDGAVLAISTRDRGTEVQVRDAASGELIHRLQHSRGLWRIAWHDDGALLAATSDDLQIHMWDTTTGQLLTTLKGHQGGPQRVAFLAGSDLLQSWGWDDTTRLWNPWTGEELLRVAGTGSQVSRDGRRLVTQAGKTITLWEVETGREYRTLPKKRPVGKESDMGGDISPDGRWLVMGTTAGVHVWDLDARKEIAYVSTARVNDAKFHPSGEELFTCGPYGLFRSPFKLDAGVLSLGPPVRLPVPGHMDRLAIDRDCRTVVTTDYFNGFRVLDLLKSDAEPREFKHFGTNWVHMSPDGRWIASSTHHGKGNKVWDAATGKSRDLIPQPQSATLTFSPDGTWLVTATNVEFGMWRLTAPGSSASPASWERARQIRREQGVDSPGSAAFTRDGTVMAITLGPSAIGLFDMATGNEITQLQSPDVGFQNLIGFTPDGSQLVVRGKWNTRVWDLRRIREQLAQIELDWNQPSYKPAPTRDAGTIKVEVDLGDYGQVAN